MKVFKIFRVYRVNASNKWEAMDVLRKAEEEGRWKELFEGEYAKEDQGEGWISGIKKQLLGK
jgi:hypothetical protein